MFYTAADMCIYNNSDDNDDDDDNIDNNDNDNHMTGNQGQA